MPRVKKALSTLAYPTNSDKLTVALLSDSEKAWKILIFLISNTNDLETGTSNEMLAFN